MCCCSMRSTVPADGAVAAAALKVPAGTTARIDYGWRGKAFRTGISWSNSSTIPAKTEACSELLR